MRISALPTCLAFQAQSQHTRTHCRPCCHAQAMTCSSSSLVTWLPTWLQLRPKVIKTQASLCSSTFSSSSSPSSSSSSPSCSCSCSCLLFPLSAALLFHSILYILLVFFITNFATGFSYLFTTHRWHYVYAACVLLLLCQLCIGRCPVLGRSAGST